MKLNILGIKRDTKYSPNSTANDRGVFLCTIEELERRGHKVQQITEDDFFHTEHINEDIIFSMIRNRQNVEKLQELEMQGKTIINSGYGIQNCFRGNMTNILLENKIPHPKSYIVSTKLDASLIFKGMEDNGIWVKRGDFHTIHKEDVTFCRNYEQVNIILKEYALRGIPNAVLSEHLTGDLVKFYAVEGTSFFYWFYPFDTSHVKFKEQVKEIQTMNHKFDLDELKLIAQKSARALNIKVYGGDAIISKEGKIQIIDINDWPSFAPCRKEAAPYIAECILKSYDINKNKISSPSILQAN